MKVFARLLGEAAQSRARSPCRRPQAAKSQYGAFFLQLCEAKCAFLLCASMVKEKAFKEFMPSSSLHTENLQRNPREVSFFIESQPSHGAPLPPQRSGSPAITWERPTQWESARSRARNAPPLPPSPSALRDRSATFRAGGKSLPRSPSVSCRSGSGKPPLRHPKEKCRRSESPYRRAGRQSGGRI